MAIRLPHFLQITVPSASCVLFFFSCELKSLIFHFPSPLDLGRPSPGHSLSAGLKNQAAEASAASFGVVQAVPDQDSSEGPHHSLEAWFLRQFPCSE